MFFNLSHFYIYTRATFHLKEYAIPVLELLFIIWDDDDSDERVFNSYRLGSFNFHAKCSFCSFYSSSSSFSSQFSSKLKIKKIHLNKYKSKRKFFLIIKKKYLKREREMTFVWTCRYIWFGQCQKKIID